MWLGKEALLGSRVVATDLAQPMPDTSVSTSRPVRIGVTAGNSAGDEPGGQVAANRELLWGQQAFRGRHVRVNDNPKLGCASGIGLVVANMMGAGVFLSAGFMAQDLGPRPILIAWVVGMVLALCGALSYATLAELVPRSGGEYRYLSELMHPALGYLAGHGSMLLGFSGPVAIDAIAAAAFLKTLVRSVHIKTVIVAVTVLHAVNLRVSKIGQNALVALGAYVATEVLRRTKR
jgi:hypothetical protein